LPTDVLSPDQRANYLNWYYQEKINLTGSSNTRLRVAQNAANSMVDALSNNVRLGFSIFNNDNGGTLLEVIDDLTPTKKTNIKSRVNAATADARTPLSETMADIGRYFATGSSNVVLHSGDVGAATQTTTAVLPSQLVNGTGWSGRTAIPSSERTDPITGITRSEPGFSTNPIQYSCQKSFNIVLTDGLPSSDRDISSNSFLSDYDGDCTLSSGGLNSAVCTGSYDMKIAYGYPGGNGGTPSKSVSGGGSESSDYFDDVTKAMFEMDMRPDLRNVNETASAKNNLTTFVVGFADDAINPTIPGVNPLAKDAAEQGGGDFLFAGNESDLTASLLRTFQFIVERNSSSSSVAANSTQFQTEAILFQAIFDSSNWSGNIKAFDILTEDVNGNGQLDGQLPPTTCVIGTPRGEDVNGNCKNDAGAIDQNNPRKIFANLLPTDPNLRRIFTIDPTKTAPSGIDFLWGSLNTAQKTALDVANVSNPASPILNFLRGDRSDEGITTGDYRVRGSILGDIVNSDPLFVGGEDFGNSGLPGTEGSSYASFVNLKKGKTQMLYAGANDGMLHGFNVSAHPGNVIAAGLNPDEGKELFAYVPNAVISAELATLTDQNYTHQYFVDGSPQYADVFFGGGWHSVLVGSMGAGSTTAVGGATGTGGRSVFALDVSNPDGFSIDNVLWEFSSRQFPDLGYTLPAPVIARMNNGKWAAIIANGYNSSGGKAALFIIDIQTGALMTGMASNPIIVDNTGSNGLSSPTAVDTSGDKIVDYIYAGDLKGNMWKFDVSNTSPASWGVAYSSGNPCSPCTPLFTAFDNATPTPARQPITSKPSVAKATATDQNSGVMVYFGTGKYFEDGDHQIPPTPQVQSFYGIWDKCDTSSASGCGGVVSGRSVLQQQSIVAEFAGTTTLSDGTTTSTVNQSVRVTSKCEVAYGSTVPTTTTPPCTTNINRLGWYMDLVKPDGTKQAERVVGSPVIRNGAVIFVTLIPTNATCQPSGTGWIMELDLSGARFTGSPIDINNDGRIDDHDLVRLDDGTTAAASGIGSTVGIIKTPAIVQTESERDTKYLSGSSGAMMTLGERVSGGNSDDDDDDECPTGDPKCKAFKTGSKIRGSWRQLR
jgi:type IV pilus assembly protein PilY1